MSAATRPGLDQYFVDMAALVSTRGTCPRRQVGCVLVDLRGRVLSTGYNGAPRGLPHCVDFPCAGRDAPSGTGFELCEAIHAEQNAVMFCGAIDDIACAYVTAAPCATCAKMLLNTGCGRIVFRDDYPSGGAAEAIWRKAGRIWVKHA